ncbi:sorbosone dehydrogenase family protein [Demequina sp. NBRC 110055]|uniref:PQQ-dependent sugar dehydrogenase n=1 Tax=Demequina sp. NBRC 110055 TaxID=1570344 RepID=UPI0009FC55C0|nr:sugar dehydrogenase [Demequina sp. NBRC 110055]
MARFPLRTAVLISAVALTACTGGNDTPVTTADATGQPSATSPSAAAPTGAPTGSPTSSPSTSAPELSRLASTPLSAAGDVNAGDAEGREVTIPEGWTAEVWADVPGARLAAWSPDGRLLVSTGDRGDVVALTPSRGAAPTQTTALEGRDNPQGLAFAEVGGREMLVLGERTRIVAFDYANGTVRDEHTLTDGLPGTGHGSKAVVVDGDHVFFSLGSESNRDPADREGDPERAVIASVPLAGGEHSVVARGVRNGFGLDVAPDGSLWTAVNQADNQPYPFEGDAYGTVVRDYVNENPVEQLTRIDEGTDLGWPYCVPDSRDGTTALPYVNDPQHNSDGERLDCALLAPTAVGLPSHSAPLGLAFTQGTSLENTIGTGALIAMHGSWNREPPREPSVAFSAWDAATATLAPPTTLMSGFQDDDGSRWGRPIMAVPGPDGAIYVTDDQAGLVYRIGPGQGADGM